jgi:maleate cis-trans isomerase
VKHTGQQIYDLVKDAIRETKKPFDGIHINCPRWPVFDMVEAVEDEFNVPVVSSCQAIIWEALNMLGIKEIKPGSGHLFNDFRKLY